MGLDVTHNAWKGAYSAFMRWREHVAEKAGLPPLRTMVGFQSYFDPNATANPVAWDSVEAAPALKVLLMHSDCEGDIAVEHLVPLAEELERLADMMVNEGTVGHIRDGMKSTTLQFAAGCRRAAEAGEPLRFW